MPDSKIFCPEKLQLLKEYIASLHVLNENAREYEQVVSSGLDGVSLVLSKERMDESYGVVRDSRKRYTDHVHELGCEIPAKRSATQQ